MLVNADVAGSWYLFVLYTTLRSWSAMLVRTNSATSCTRFLSFQSHRHVGRIGFRCALLVELPPDLCWSAILYASPISSPKSDSTVQSKRSVWTGPSPPFVHTGNGTQRKAEKNGFLKPDVPPRPTSVMRGVQDERKLHKGSQHRNTKVVDEGTALQDRLARLALEREQLNLSHGGNQVWKPTCLVRLL